MKFLRNSTYRKDWRCLQSEANRSRSEIPCFRGRIGNFGESADFQLAATDIRDENPPFKSQIPNDGKQDIVSQIREFVCGI